MKRIRSKLVRILLWVIGAHVVVGMIGYTAIQISPWPAVFLIRYAFGLGGEAIAAGLQDHVPQGVSEILNERYDTSENAFLDVYFPSTVSPNNALPTVVWVHGGGFVAGDKSEIANYLRIIAARGFTVVGINYALAPDHRYPLTLQQADAALTYLTLNARRLRIEPRFVIAGDSAGAHIAAQFANVVSSPRHAEMVGVTPTTTRAQLIGAILFCGPYDFERTNVEGVFGTLLKAMPWSYTGTKNFVDDSRFAALSIAGFVTEENPPTFISVGNGDRLAPQSKALAAALAGHGVPVETLFFPDEQLPSLPHEYQFNLNTEAGKLALEKMMAFLMKVQRGRESCVKNCENPN